MKQEDTIVAQVYVTTDYDKFKFIGGNRSCEHASKIRRSTETIGQLLIPIIVNAKYEVLDGQGRLTAWREMGLPIPYIITESATITAIREINNASTVWSTGNYIDSYADLGNDAYKVLRELTDKYAPRIPRKVVHAIASGRMSYSGAQELRTGKFKLAREVGDIESELDFLAKLGMPKAVRGRKETIYSVLAFCYESDEIHNAILCKQWELYSEMIGGVADTKMAAEEVEKIYNYKRRTDKHVFISHLYREEAIKRNAAGTPGGGGTAWD